MANGQQPSSGSSDLSFVPATPARWDDLEALFGDNGACGGCWCMWWRLSHREFEAEKGKGNRDALKKLIGAGETPGLLAYRGDRAVGWCAVAPRSRLPRLERSRILAPVDEQPVWSIVCLFVSREHRRQGVSEALVRAAVEFAVDQGARIVEGYPVEPKKEKIADVFAFHGLASTFRRVGFHEVTRRSDTRPIMRWAAGPQLLGD